LLTITLKLVNVNNACAAISGAAIYIWHCDAAGLYSLYSSGVTTESYLRGVQVTDANGEVTFTTIYPACYSGRWPHIHFEVFTGGLTSASTGRTSSLFRNWRCRRPQFDRVQQRSRYSASISNYSNISIASDNVFGDNIGPDRPDDALAERHQRRLHRHRDDRHCGLNSLPAWRDGGGGAIHGGNARVDQRAMAGVKSISAEAMPRDYDYFGPRLAPALFGVLGAGLFFWLMAGLADSVGMGLILSTLYLCNTAQLDL
jgi:hypothetical protein